MSAPMTLRSKQHDGLGLQACLAVGSTVLSVLLPVVGSSVCPGLLGSNTRYALVGIAAVAGTVFVIGLVSKADWLPRLLFTSLFLFLTLDASIPLLDSATYAGSGRAEMFLVDLPIMGFLVLALMNRTSIGGTPRDAVARWVPLSLMFLAIVSVTAFRAKYPMESIFVILYFCRGLLLFIMVRYLVTNESQLARVVRLLLFVLLFHSLLAVMQWWNQGPVGGGKLTFLGENNPSWTWLEWFYYHGVPVSLFGRSFGIYVSGLTGSAYRLAIILELMIPLAFTHYLFGSGESIRRGMSLAATVLGVIALILASNRTSWIAVMVALSVVTVLGLRRHASETLPFRFISLTAAATVVFSIFFAVVYTRLLRTNLEVSSLRRSLYQSEAVSLILSHPLLGVGIGNYGAATGISNVVHNGYLLLLAEVGPVAVLTYAYIVFRSFRSGLSRAVAKADPVGITSLGVLGGVLAYLLHAVFDWVVFRPNVLATFWALLGLLVAVSRIDSTK